MFYIEREGIMKKKLGTNENFGAVLVVLGIASLFTALGIVSYLVVKEFGAVGCCFALAAWGIVILYYGTKIFNS